HASDAEGDAISLSATLPSFGVLNMPQSGMGDVATSITLSPGFSDAGSHSATVTEAGGASVTFGITVSNTDQGLVLTAPASLSAAERTLLTVDVTASDPDGEPVTSLTADLSGLPAGHDAAFAIVGDPLPAVAAAGRLTWTPGCDMAGTYTVTFSGTSGNLATAVTTIAVADVGTPPSIGPIADPIVAEASLLDVAVSASDAEGDPIALSATLPVFGSFVDNGGGNGTITLAPGYLHSGTYPGSVTATEGCDGSASLAFTITVLNTDRPVTLAAAASEAASEGVPFSMTVLAHDDDGETIALSADLSALPAGNDAAFGDAAVGMLEREGTLTWTPTYDDAGSYPVTFTATAGLATATATTTIAVANTNRMPSVSAPASRSVNEGSALSIAISASDPDGAATPLTLSANFSGLPSGPSFADNGDNTGLFTWTPTYADASGSPYFVTFSASDGSGGSGSAVTQILVLDVASAIAFPASKSVLRLSSGKPTYCAVLEPVGGSFVLTDVDWASVRMNSTGTGTVSSIGIDATKPVVVGDQNGNLTQDATFCFGKTELRNIFAFVSGRQTVPVTITGSLMGGATFIASLNVEVIGTGGALTASVSPNPLNPEAVLTFEIASATSVRVTLHDIQGRLVRSLANESMAAGWHDLRIDGRDDGGRALRSGVYFYRIETGAGVKTGQLTILK
ncbi:MAG TPA: putative Ig domain-containing protein, partial [Candidatus Eisenbacteria bacterium]|nr:putative Ig domain-containing protein [Candidatus Eisenbacteria bacterium]